jgi:hypothetical protein
MGKRELLIAIAFVVAGVVAYQFTAPPPKPGEQGFSLSRFWSNARRGMRPNAAQQSITQSGTISLGAAVTDLRVSDFSRGIRILGETRTDIAYEMAVVSNGPDPAAALELAKQVAIKQDDLGATLRLRITYPRAGTQSASLVLRVPTRLAVRIDGGTGAYASKVAGLDLSMVNGDVTFVEIAGPVVGQHRNGDLHVTGASSVKLTLTRSRATFEHIQKGLTLDVREGECRIDSSQGPVQIDASRAEITVANHDGPTRVAGTGGTITLNEPRSEVRVDMQRAEVEVRLSRAVPVTALTSDDTLRLLLDPALHASIDAISEAGQIQAADFSWESEAIDRDHRLSRDLGGGGPRLSLRNVRGEIVIRKSK